jgi:hypothetical protein
MSPITRSQTRMKQGKRAKATMEQPPVMFVIASYLYENNDDNSHNLMKNDLNNLSLVFKSRRTRDVLDKYMMDITMDELRMKQFYYTAVVLIRRHHQFHTLEAQHRSMYALFNHFVVNKDILERNQPVLIALKNDILKKLDMFNTQCPIFKERYGSTFVKLIK